jgi:DNA polymerase III sliding clamp (beta) subunit (PCNA family)
MKFNISAGEFANALKPVLEVATRDVQKEHTSAGKITLDADENGIIAYAFGGTSSIKAVINNSNIGGLSYSFSVDGKVTVDAVTLVTALRSFRNSESVEIYVESGSLNIHLVEEEDVYQTMATYKDNITIPIVAKSYSKEIEVNREIFIESFSKVDFAVAFEQKMARYMCVVLEASKNKVRLASGSGGRFAVCDVDGKDVVKSSGSTQIIFPKTAIGIIKSVIGSALHSTINIKYAEYDSKEGSAEQIVIEFGGITLCIFGIDSAIKYPNLDNVIKSKYSNHAIIVSDDFKFAIKGVDVSKNVSKDGLHNTDVTWESENGKMIFETRSLAKARRKCRVIPESTIKGSSKPWFRAASTYLAEISSRLGDIGTVEMYFEDQENYKDSDENVKIKPVLVKFAESVNKARETTEKFYIFFVVSTK